MIATDKEALICDFAETYRIYDFEALSAEYAAILAVGLRDSSRIKQKISGMKADLQTQILAYIADYTAINVYGKTKEAKSGINKPKSILKALFSNNETKQYTTGADFMAEWERINGN